MTGSAKRPRKRPAPLSIRLTEEERAQLERDAAGQALSAYIKAVLFDDDASRHKNRQCQPVKDYQKLALALALLGKMNTLETMKSFLASDGKRLFIPADMKAEVSEACAEIRQIRACLITALGVKAERSS